ncbi:phage protein [Vibrio phage pTD1]|uniref:Phage protein n=1 Tax=Vibrio phage pTD1 TaxID=1938577 RepID=A0A1Q2U359_9CAUD|nr:phage protein [Vibrio phage pTD1]BAW98405.1 phage protein [Vibrio phage pTD1]
MSDKATSLDSFDPFEGVATTDPVSRSAEQISSDVGSIRKQATDPIDASSEDNYLGIESVMPSMDGLDETLNGFKSQTLGQMTEAYQSKTENFSIKDARDLLDVESGKIKINKEAVLDDISDIVGYNIGNSETFKGQAGDTLFDLFVQLTDPDGGSLLDKNGDQLSFKDGWRDGTTEGLIYALGMAGYELYQDVKDSAKQDAFDATMLYSAAQAGMVEAYAEIYGKIKPQSKANDMMINAIKYVISNGDYFSFREMLKILGKAQYPKIRSTYPTLPRDLLSAYYMDKKVYPHEHEVLCKELDGHLSDIYGVDWYLVPTAHGDAYNVLIGSECSNDAMILLRNEERLRIIVMLRGTFNEGRADDTFFDHFPDTPVINIR